MRRMTSQVALTLFVVLACAVIPSSAQKEPCNDSCGAATLWDEFNQFQLKLTRTGHSGYDSWRGAYDPTTYDTQIEVESSDGVNMEKGKLLMIGGRMMAYQGPVVHSGFVTDALDLPALEQQTVNRILGKVFPKGPAEIEESKEFDYRSEHAPIQVATSTGDLSVPAPWHALGKIRRIDREVFQYEIRLQWKEDHRNGKEAEEYFAGQFSKSKDARIDDSLSLADWKLYGMGVDDSQQNNGSTGGNGTRAAYRTVADVRREIAKDEDPGEPDSTKDFTGFWMEDCNQAWGLQIMHYGKDGKYSVVFCGPGGCGTPKDDGRITFITKDRHYEVKSEDEISEISDEKPQTYHRCTKNPNPVLRYKKEPSSTH